jgi:hypothetical protein
MPPTEIKRSTAHLPRNLIAAGYGGPIPSPRRVYDLVLRGVIPAENISGRWYYADADLRRIAEVLGMSAPAAPRTRPRKDASASAAQSQAA